MMSFGGASLRNNTYCSDVGDYVLQAYYKANSTWKSHLYKSLNYTLLSDLSRVLTGCPLVQQQTGYGNETNIFQ